MVLVERDERAPARPSSPIARDRGTPPTRRAPSPVPSVQAASSPQPGSSAPSSRGRARARARARRRRATRGSAHKRSMRNACPPRRAPAARARSARPESAVGARPGPARDPDRKPLRADRCWPGDEPPHPRGPRSISLPSTVPAGRAPRRRVPVAPGCSTSCGRCGPIALQRGHGRSSGLCMVRDPSASRSRRVVPSYCLSAALITIIRVALSLAPPVAGPGSARSPRGLRPPRSRGSPEAGRRN
jgi:hypothetical protein